MSKITVFIAKEIITMDPSLPKATAVAVRDGRIIEVGSLESLAPWLQGHSHEIDDQFKDKVLMPGLIDPHLHPSMAAILLNMRFITAAEWRLPWETVRPVTTKQAFLDRLIELDQELEDPNEPLFTWGYHQLWHDKIVRKDIDETGITRPIVVWHRSFHEIIVNTAMMKWMEFEDSAAVAHPQANFAEGHFYENGLKLVINRLNPYILEPNRYMAGMMKLKQVVHFGGHTTVGDMAAGIFDFNAEWQATAGLFENDQTPFRIQLIPAGNMLQATYGTPEATEEFIRTLPERNTHRLEFRKAVKLFTDGAFFSQLMMLEEPGYIDGHDGEWLMTPEQFEEATRVYWNLGYRIHVHCTGSLGLELALDTLAKLQFERPRFDHRYTIEHFGLSTTEQVRRIAALGAQVSANVYYLFETGDLYAQKGLGYERASQIARVGSVARHKIPLAFHSDYTMAPALPFNSVHVAVNRRTMSGHKMCPQECLSVEQALRAITIDAAYILGMEHEIGSIRSGKKADFTVLEISPFDVDHSELKDIQILGTVFEGRSFPIETMGNE